MPDTPQQLDRDFLTVRQTAAYLQITTATVQRLIKGGTLSGSKLGTSPNSPLRISSASIEKMLERNSHSVAPSKTATKK